MMSYTTLAASSRPIFSHCYTEHSQRCGAVLSGCITTVAIFRSGQLGLCCTVEPNCSGLSACLAVTSVTRDRALDTCEPSCVPGAARPFFIHVVHSQLGAAGYMTTSKLSSQGGEARATRQPRIIFTPVGLEKSLSTLFSTPPNVASRLCSLPLLCLCRAHHTSELFHPPLLSSVHRGCSTLLPPSPVFLAQEHRKELRAATSPLLCPPRHPSPVRASLPAPFSNPRRWQLCPTPLVVYPLDWK
jgi:hypothetical protein